MAALRLYVPLENGGHAMNTRATSPDLDSLCQLPLEMQHAIVLSMDIEIILVWRRVNKRAMNLVADLSDWKKLHTAHLNIMSSMPSQASAKALNVRLTEPR